ncbi:MAG: protein kinase [Acidobacteriota bacterium]
MSQSSAAVDTRIGPYRLEETLGAGGMGEVYRAVDERLDRQVAIKQALPNRAAHERTRRRFRLEARAAAALNHPAIVKIYDIVTVDGVDWIVMEYVEGRPLSKVLQAGALQAGHALDLLTPIAEGLVQAHEAGILHRDLKTGNVMVTAEGRAKLLDFGLVKRLESPEGDPSLTSEGRLIGTPRAMSPEQALGERLDVRSDLFSFGILLYETVTGENPFYSPNALRTLHRVCFHQQEPASDLQPTLPAELCGLIDQLLEKDREMRPQSTRELADSLAQLARTHPPESPSARLPQAATGPLETASRSGRGSSSGSIPGARRRVTVLHCELASAGDSQILDPEDLIEIRPHFHDLAEATARAHRGRLDELLDHGFRLCFGFSDDPKQDVERALEAASSLIESVEELASRSLFDGGEEPAVRIGIHSGPVVFVSEGTDDERLAYGETGAVAATLQRLGEANSILLSAAARDLLGGEARTERLPPTPIPGRSRDLDAYRWTRAR